jgi:hypothetical protein
MTSDGVVTTIAGTIGTPGSTNGSALSASFNGPRSVAIDSNGVIYVADTNNHCIRRIDNDGNVETFAGLPGVSGYVDGSATESRFNRPLAVATDKSGNVFVADGSTKIRKISKDGQTITIGGSGQGYSEGIATSAMLNTPTSITTDDSGRVYVTDGLNNTRVFVGGVMPAQEILSPEQTVMEGTEGVISFGQSILGRTSTKEITLKNRGTAALEVQCAFLGANASEFSLAGGLTSVSVPAGGQLSLAVQHTPLGSQGERAAQLRLTSNDVIQPNLLVTLGSTAIDAKPVFNLSPANAIAKDPGQSVTFAALYISGLEPFTYRWRRNGVVISGATGSIYTIASAQQSHEGSYDCVISNTYGSFTTSATVLTVNDPVVIVGAPLGRFANVDELVTFRVTAVGTPPLSYQWRKNGVVLPDETAASLSFLAGATSGGFYDVVVTNPLGSVASTTAALTVLTPPAITLQPTDQAIALGSTAFFSVTASGPALSYQWRRNGVDLKGQIASILTIPNAQVANEGVYDVIVRNSFGVVLSNPVRLSLPVTLSLTQEPEDVLATTDDTATFSVTALGSGVLTYQWLKDGKPLKGATAATLTVPVSDASAVGAYSVVVTSGKLKVTSRSAQLRVEDEGLLIYRISATGSSFAGTSSTNVQFTGLLILDRFNQRGGFIRYGKNGKLDTFGVEVDDGLRTHSTGPVPQSQTVVSKVMLEGSAPSESMASFWLRGVDGVQVFSATDRTVAPKTLSGFQTDLRNEEGTEVETLSLTATIDPAASLQARQGAENVEQTLSRLAAGLQQRGFVQE